MRRMGWRRLSAADVGGGHQLRRVQPREKDGGERRGRERSTGAHHGALSSQLCHERYRERIRVYCGWGLMEPCPVSSGGHRGL